MKLVLHIGTYKTGTTALQEFLRANESALSRNGFHYAATGSGLNANAVANAVALGDVETPREFFQHELEVAASRGAHTVVVSAENFYSMNLVAAVFSKRELVDPFAEQRQAVERLKGALPAALSGVRLVCYFRRPDRFAESLYNQRIKYENYDEPFNRYLRLVECALAYGRNASIWSDVFGKGNCVFKIYESVSGDIRADFLRDVLKLKQTESFVTETSRANERMSRDVLEFKRSLNARIPDRERDVQYRIACLVDQRLDLLASEPRHHQEFLSPQLRAELLERCAAESAALQASFGLPPFPAYDPQQDGSGWSPYPGLPEDRRAHIQREYDRVSGRLEFRLERFVLRLPAVVRRRAGRRLLSVPRRLESRRAARAPAADGAGRTPAVRAGGD